MAPFTEATWCQLQNLFPDPVEGELPAEIAHAMESLLSLDTDTLKRRCDPTRAADEGLLSIVARLPQGKSPGPSGLRAEHLQGATQQTQSGLDSCTAPTRDGSGEIFVGFDSRPSQQSTPAVR
mmetsp:Transcript_14650/g.59622  ORF Transcript_14650/g.59622 Transcript_14650/m.59622 type:complete len:123 (-) Transcript_14650:3880-4248(-)